jgi:EF hand
LIVKVKTVLMASAMAGAMTLGGAAAFSPMAWAAPSSVLKALDTDTDGTVDLTEAKAAASKLFDQLDPDKDGTLDRRELRGRLNAKDMAAGDPDKDGTLDKNEYLAIVEQRFKAADPDTDGTLDDKELKSSAGRALRRLLMK